MTFSSALLGEVSHPTNILTEYLSLFRGRKKCKAHILSWLDGEIYKKLAAGKPPWVYVVCQELADEFGYCRDTVQRHITDLYQMGLLKRLPYKRWATDNIWQYTIDCSSLLAHLIQSFTRAISKSASLGHEWIRLLTSDAENQTADCLNSARRESEISATAAEIQATYTNPDSSHFDPHTTKTASPVEKEIGEKVKAMIADVAPFMQPGDGSRTLPPKETIFTDNSSAALDDELNLEGENFNSKETIKIPQLEELKRCRVEVNSPSFLWIASKFPQRLDSAITAWLHWAKTENVDKPTRSLIAAIKNNWQPKLSPREAWWNDAAQAWGRDKRDRLINAVVEYGGNTWLYFKNGQQLTLDKARLMSWDELAQMGGGV